jgi:RNA polymerase sigma-70 factor (ECF subfamily)
MDLALSDDVSVEVDRGSGTRNSEWLDHNRSFREDQSSRRRQSSEFGNGLSIDPVCVYASYAGPEKIPEASNDGECGFVVRKEEKNSRNNLRKQDLPLLMTTGKLKPWTDALLADESAIDVADSGEKHQSQSESDSQLTPQEYQGVNDARLVEEARRGEQAAFGELVNRYERRLMRVIKRFIRDEELARDLAQETFLRVYEKLDMFDPSRRFGPWLFRIGVNLTLDYLRKRKRRGRWALFSESPSEQMPDPGVEDPRRYQNLQEEVRAVLEEIPENYRSVLILRDLENFSTSEIAAILNRKEATIRWRLAEARTRFQKLWEQRQAQTQ